MKIIITESQYEMLSSSLKRRLGEKDLDIIDSIIDSNLHFWTARARNVDDFTNRVIYDSLNEFVTEYKIDEYVVYDREDEEDEYYEEKEVEIYKLFSDLVPFLEVKYKDKLSDYYKRHKK